MTWMLQETDHCNEVVRKVMFDDKPNTFMVADYVPSVPHHQALLEVDMVGMPNGHTWALVEIADTADPELVSGWHPSHNTRISDSPHYDIVCEDCGATDGTGHEHLMRGPCEMAVYPPELGNSVRALRRVFDKETLYKLVYNGDKYAAKWLEFGEIIGQITYKRGWYFRSGIEDGRMWVQVGVTADAEIAYDPVAKAVVPWRGAKHYLSPHMCRQEIVGTVHHAIERAEMHELNEWFRYRGRAIYNPHLDPDRLAEFAAKLANFNTRENAMTMEEPG